MESGTYIEEIEGSRSQVSLSLNDQLNINQLQSSLLQHSSSIGDQIGVNNVVIKTEAQYPAPDVLPSRNNVSYVSNAVVIQQDTNSKICVVCNDRASGKHYGVYSCEGCKVSQLTTRYLVHIPWNYFFCKKSKRDTERDGDLGVEICPGWGPNKLMGIIQDVSLSSTRDIF